MAQKLELQLKELGSKLDPVPSSKDSLIKLLKQAATCLSEMDQSPSASVLESMDPFFKAIVKPELLKHQDRDVKLLVATCICEITRITAPEAPYDDDVLKDIFHLVVGTFSGLTDTSGPSFGRRVVILETLARYRSCVVMLDLECDDLVNEMFSTFFAVASDDHPESVLSSMQTIMSVLLEESEDIREDLLLIILLRVGRSKKNVRAASRKLAMNVIQSCALKLEPAIKQFLVSSMSGDDKLSNDEIDYHEVIYDIYQCAPQILAGVIPYLAGELLTDQLEIRLKAVRLVGDLFSLGGRDIPEAFQPVFSEFLKRLTDRAVEIRMLVLGHVKGCLLSNPSRPEASQIISALCDRLLDYDENVRKQVVSVICDVASRFPSSIPAETIKLIADRLRDKSPLVKKYTMERLAEIFKVHCANSDQADDQWDFDWIPGKILRCFYDKDFRETFVAALWKYKTQLENSLSNLLCGSLKSNLLINRSDTIEAVLYGSLFQSECSIKDRVKYWIRFFSKFDKVEVKALERILEQKQRLQQEMLKYLSLRQMHQNGDTPELQKKIPFCFKIMSRFFPDPVKAEEDFQILDQLKDVNAWKILTFLLDPSTTFQQGFTYRDDLLKILGEKHRLHDFLSILSVKCSYLLFNKDHVKEIFLETSVQKPIGNAQCIQSCMNLLVILARYSPPLFIGTEEELVISLKDDNNVMKEGALQILAKAGGIVREQLAESSSSVDLVLERLCLEGSRKQAKYAVHALAAITKDDGLKSLSVLYKRLVDLLEEKTHLPAVLQSLGCIAQTAMAVFETRENEIKDFINSKILRCSNKQEKKGKARWDNRSEMCLLKIYGIKTLVKSYMPVKDAHLRPGIDDLLATLRNILSFGEIAEDVQSSSVDKSHMKLASAKAILRLSKYWDQKIPVDVFHLTLRASEISFPQARKQFLGKIHQYIKDRYLDTRYACAFLLGIDKVKTKDYEEERQSLADIIQMQYQAKARQQNMQTDSNALSAYPEYILPYLVHLLAHHSCPNVDECKDVKAFELIYRQMHLTLSMLLHGDEDGKSDSSTNKEKESVSSILSILWSIKHSDDVVDAGKSKNSYAICDLGMLIMKQLTQADPNLGEPSASFSLPPMLYKLRESKEEDKPQANEGITWLVDESIRAHFESLKLDTNNTINQEGQEDEDHKDNQKDGAEVPLKKIIKSIKSQGSKGKKLVKNKSTNAQKNKVESDIDVLQMVREINIDSRGTPTKFDSVNGHEENGMEEEQAEQKQQNVEKNEASIATPGSIPKRRRSSSAHNGLRTTKRHATNSEDRVPSRKKLLDTTDSDLLISCIRKGTVTSSKNKSKITDAEEVEQGKEALADDTKKPLVRVETDETFSANAKSPKASLKKPKRKSITGLAKCTSKEAGGVLEEDLIGCRVKVWWPMDKQFYVGTIKSYDPSRKKHVVLYDDGDVEILNLVRERWELIDKGKLAKHLKSSKGTSKKASTGKKNKNSTGKRGVKNLVETAKGKRTPKKNVVRRQRSISGSDDDADGKGISDISDDEPSSSKDNTKSEFLEGQHTQEVDGQQMDPKKSQKKVNKRKQIKGSGKSTDHSKGDEVKDEKGGGGEEYKDMEEEEGYKDMEQEKGEEEEEDRYMGGGENENMEEERGGEDEVNEDMVSPLQGAQRVDEESSHTAEETDEEEIEVELENVKSNLKRKGSHMKSSLPRKAAKIEIPDDEPLKLWKKRVAKLTSK